MGLVSLESVGKQTPQMKRCHVVSFVIHSFSTSERFRAKSWQVAACCAGGQTDGKGTCGEECQGRVEVIVLIVNSISVATGQAAWDVGETRGSAVRGGQAAPAAPDR